MGKKINQSTLIGLFSFISIFVFQIILNTNIPCMRSLPDEIGAVALGAKFAGLDWSYVLVHPAYYYGSASFPFAYLVFKLIHDPMIQYQFLLAVAALVRSVSAFVAVKISMDFYQVSACNAFIYGVICTLITPTRACNIDNEPFLICICWVMLYFFMILCKEENTLKKKWYSFWLAFFLVYAQFAHTRAFLFIVLLLFILVLYYATTNKKVVDVPVFIISFGACYWICKRAISWCTLNIFTDQSNTTEIIPNTVNSLIYNTIENIKIVFSIEGINGFLDLLFSNLWISGVFGFGIIIYSLFVVYKKFFSIVKSKMLHRKILAEDDLFYPALFCAAGILATVAALSITWLSTAIAVHIEGIAPSRAHFYLRYYGCYFGILALYFLIHHYDEGFYIIKYIFITIIVIKLSASYCIFSFINPAQLSGHKNIDWFGYFAPFSFSGSSWSDPHHDIGYFFRATVLSIILFLLCYIKKRKHKLFLIMPLLLAFLYQYIYSTIYWDKEFASGKNYYLSANSIYELKKEFPDCFEGISVMYYMNEKYGAQYIVQFLVSNIKVISAAPGSDIKEALVLSARILTEDDINLQDYKIIMLDDNEILYIKGEKLQEIFESAGLKIEETELYVEEMRN